MNDQLRQLRLKEIGPLKDAIMYTRERASDHLPPLTQGGFFGLEQWRELHRSIELLSLRTVDKKLDELCSQYLKACEDANELWFAALHKLKATAVRDPVYDEDDVTRDKVELEYQKTGGDTRVADIKRLYIELSVHLETLLK